MPTNYRRQYDPYAEQTYDQQLYGWNQLAPRDAPQGRARQPAPAQPRQPLQDALRTPQGVGGQGYYGGMAPTGGPQPIGMRSPNVGVPAGQAVGQAQVPAGGHDPLQAALLSGQAMQAPPAGPAVPGGQMGQASAPPSPNVADPRGSGRVSQSNPLMEGFNLDRALSYGDPKSAKDAFARIAANAPREKWATKAGAEEWIRNEVKPLMDAAGFTVMDVAGEKMLVSTTENPEGEWVDVVRQADAADAAIQWLSEKAQSNVGPTGNAPLLDALAPSAQFDEQSMEAMAQRLGINTKDPMWRQLFAQYFGNPAVNAPLPTQPGFMPQSPQQPLTSLTPPF